ncbi:bacteriocin-type signal sequence-containing protein [Ruminococcaceae bacterium YRB3002]|nr:bacteriocin-type signal sequence-containing protein [Ruminococcaceae bacterium YRB3002]
MDNDRELSEEELENISGGMMFPDSECTIDEFVSFVDKYWPFM